MDMKDNENLYFDAMRGMGDIGHLSIIAMTMFAMFFVALLINHLTKGKIGASEAMILVAGSGIIFYMGSILLVGKFLY